MINGSPGRLPSRLPHHLARRSGVAACALGQGGKTKQGEQFGHEAPSHTLAPFGARRGGVVIACRLVTLVFMDIQSFVGETLRQIVMGVHQAQEATMNTVATINPNRIVIPGQRELMSVPHPDLVQRIDFDIAVTVEELKTKKVEGGVDVGGLIKVLGIKAEGAIETHGTNSSVSRVKFTVPIYLPPGKPKASQFD